MLERDAEYIQVSGDERGGNEELPGRELDSRGIVNAS